MNRTGFLRLLFAATVLAAIGCKDSATEPSPTNIEGVQFDASAPTFKITNHTSKPVFLMVIAKSNAPLVDWLPCVDAEECPPIPSHESRTRTYDSYGFSSTEAEALVYWWHAVEKDGELQPDRIREGTIRLR